jgi:hypothetical protein
VTDPVKGITRRISRRCSDYAVTEIHDQRSVPWRSLLFNGAHHSIELRLFGDHLQEALRALETEIGDPEFAISGHIVADIEITDVDCIDATALVTIDALTIEESC